MSKDTFYKIKLDLVKNTINNFIHIMQYDDGVADIRAEIYKDLQLIDPSSEFDSAELRLHKPGGGWIKCNNTEPYIHCNKPSYATAIASEEYYYYAEGSYVKITSSMTEQTYNELDPTKIYKNVGILLVLEKDHVIIHVVKELTDTYGGCPAVIDFYSINGHIQTAKFVLDVDRNPIQTGETLTNIPDDAEAKIIELENKIKKAVMYVSQSLTENEKAQARKNIGIDGDFYTKEQIDASLLLKVNRYTGTGKRVYASINGTDSTLEYSDTASGNSVAYRLSNGRLKVGAPVSDDDATTKKYVSDLIDSEVDEISKTEIDNLEL